MLNYILGVSLELISAVFQNLGLNLQRLAHRRQIQQREIAQNFNRKISYCTNHKWFFALFIYIIGVVLDFAALSLVPLTVTLPVGSIGIGLNCAFASALLRERFTVCDCIGCVSVITGAAFVIALQVKEMEQIGIDQVQVIFTGTGLYFFIGMCVVWTVLFILQWVWKNVFTAGIMPGATSVFTIMFGSIVGQMALKTVQGENQMKFWQFWAVLAGLVVFLLLMNEFLQRANSVYDNMVIIPIFFTSTLLLNVLSGIFFFKYLSGISIIEGVLFGIGVFFVVLGCILLSVSHIGVGESDLRELVERGDEMKNQHIKDSEIGMKYLNML